MRELLKSTYQFTDYQIAQLGFLAKTLLSEISKIVIIGLFFRKEIPFYIICMFILALLRTSTGGLHCKTYLSCLVASCFYITFTFKILPLIPISRIPAMILLILCAVIDYRIGPVTSDVHLPLTEKVKQRGRICTVITISLFFILMYIIPENLYAITGFWIIISHTLQLIAAKIRKKGAQKKMKQKFIAMMGSLLTACMAFSWWIGSDMPSILVLGEFSYPRQEEK